MKHVDGWWVPDICSGAGKYLRRSQVIPEALRHWHGPRRWALQAGGHVGTFARMLAQYFDRVLTIEPAPDNFACLARNVLHSPKIDALYGALGAGEYSLDLSLQTHGTGGHHVAIRADLPTVTVPAFFVDQWEYAQLDMLVLDLEGYEWFALHGAVQTLMRCQPLIIIEDNSCAQRYGIAPRQVPQWLCETFGYTMAGMYDEDLILVPGMP